VLPLELDHARMAKLHVAANAVCQKLRFALGQVMRGSILCQ
jgi:hypothetical protein